jgi:hypothetical protein
MNAGAGGFSVRIFVPDGDPDGLKLVEKSNWTGRGLQFPRTLYPNARQREELERTGVYVLMGQPEAGELPRVYVGEGDVVRERFDQHIKKKDFWSHAVVFTSKDQNLNKAHVRYLEARLYQLAHEAKRCDLDNDQAPGIPPLSEADRADVEAFLGDILLCLPVLGISVFERAAETAQAHTELHIQSKDAEARGFETTQGLVVREGSVAAGSEAPSIHAYMSSMRQTLIDKGVLVADGERLRFAQDYTFASPSTAAGVVLGRTANGRTEWKDSKGVPLKSLQEAVGNA